MSTPPDLGPLPADILALSDAYPGMALADQCEAERQRCYMLCVAAASQWRPIESAPRDGTPFLAWYPKHCVDDDGESSGEVIGGACAMVACTQGLWEEPDWLDAHGSYYMDDWCFAEEPTHWMPLPSAPTKEGG